MQEQDREKFWMLLNSTSEMYGKSNPSKILFKLWWSALRDYQYEDVARAFSSHLKNTDTGQFMPKVADIVRVFEGTSDNKSAAAWMQVDKAVREHGSYPDIVFNDPIIHACIEALGGWVKLCTKDDREWVFVQKDFERYYKTYIGKQVLTQERLSGLVSMNSSKIGVESKEVVYIGFERESIGNSSLIKQLEA